jgi:dihydrofolate reductase
MRGDAPVSRLLYSMGVSLDGYVAGPGGEIGWAEPDPELHRFHEEQTRRLGLHLCGRRLYEEMLPWETRDDDFGRIWQALPKLVFSHTLREVEGNATLATLAPAEAVAHLKRDLERDIEVGGAGLAASVIDLVDEFNMFVSPVVLGGGTPYFAPGAQLELELVGVRTFGSVTHLRHRRRDAPPSANTPAART